MLAFAANSVLCRPALGQFLIDASNFTAMRIASGAVTLWLIRRFSAPPGRKLSIGWRSASMLFLYALTFSFAYTALETGAAALNLPALVQLTVIGVGLWQGQRPNRLAWTRMLIAIGELVYLVSPGLTASPLRGAALMIVAGLPWGIYSLRHKRDRDAVSGPAATF